MWLLELLTEPKTWIDGLWCDIGVRAGQQICEKCNFPLVARGDSWEGTKLHWRQQMSQRQTWDWEADTTRGLITIQNQIERTLGLQSTQIDIDWGQLVIAPKQSLTIYFLVQSSLSLPTSLQLVFAAHNALLGEWKDCCCSIDFLQFLWVKLDTWDLLTSFPKLLCTAFAGVMHYWFNWLILWFRDWSWKLN